MVFSSRGLIYKTNHSFCKTWEDIFEIEGRDNKYKRSKFKSKYKEDIKQVEFVSKGRKYVYMIASKELANNKQESDLQKIARGYKVTSIKTNSKATLEVRTKSMVKQIFCILSNMILNQWDGRYELIDGMVVDIRDTGEIVFSHDKIVSAIRDGVRENIGPEDIAWMLLLDIKSRVDNITVQITYDAFGGILYEFKSKDRY